jgi:integrase
MTENHPTPPARPAKPSADFPLFAHASGVWAKKIRGKLHYFGPWSDPAAALGRYQQQAADLHAGRSPRADPDALTVRAMANHFLTAKQKRVDTGELSPRTWADYKEVCDLVVKVFTLTRLVSDLQPDDFGELRDKMTSRWGPVRVWVTIQKVRSVFKHAYDAGLIDRPMRFGPGFQRPTKKTLRLHRARQGPKLFTADEIRRLVGAAGTPLKAMILLGINCGFGNADCGNLPQTALDLDGGFLNFPRPKTGLPRRCALWPETVQTLREALAKRPAPKDPAHEQLVFITNHRLSWAKTDHNNPLWRELRTLLSKLQINGRKGLGFYTLRHTFRTVADGAKDQPAADYIMGHEVPHMSSVYRETISDERLRAVAEHVRAWLFGPGATPA